MISRIVASFAVAASLVVGVIGAQAAGATGTANSSNCQGYNVSAFTSANRLGPAASQDAQNGTLVGYVQNAANCGK